MKIIGGVCVVAGGFLLAIVAVVSYRYVCRGYNIESASEDAMPDHMEALQQFRGHYGRLCTLVAGALCREIDGAYVPDPDADVDEIVQAARGEGTSNLTVHRQLRWQRSRVDRATAKCQDACVPTQDFIEAGTEIRLAVDEEWSVNIPSLAV